MKKHCLFLLSGRQPVQEQLKERGSQFVAVLMEHEEQGHGISSTLPRFLLTKELFKDLDIFGTKGPLLVGKLPDFPESTLDSPPKGLELMLGLGDPANLGAIIRSARAFDVSCIHLLKESAHPYHPKALRSSSGHSLSMNYRIGPSIHELKDSKSLYKLDMKGQKLKDFNWPRNLRLLIGEEGPGLPSTLRQHNTLQIPFNNDVESLNAAVAASIAMYGYSLSKL
jgi:TrmH family RNA methyltransferase